MELKELYELTKERMNKTINALHSEYDSIRAGRASAKVLDKIQADYYGTPTPIAQMASVSNADARTLVI
ncbi:MAG: ribosome recycling factor, partial [Clostridia bacterium]|nr:ribosome recycling factor [Clostridia bacterium]